MTDSYAGLPNVVRGVFDELSHLAGNAGDVGFQSRWDIADVLFENGPMAHVDEARKLDAVAGALREPQAAVMLAREILGDDIQCNWFWNSCQGHYAELTAFARDNAEMKWWHREETFASATGASISLALVAALVLVKAKVDDAAKAKPAEAAA